MENYSIITLIGEGSYGKVFKATENESKNTVALKIILKVFFYWPYRKLKIFLRNADLRKLG